MKGMHKGQLVLWQGRAYSYEASLSLERVHLLDKETQQYIDAPIGELSLLPKEKEARKPGGYSRGMEDIPDREWALAERKFQEIQSYFSSNRENSDFTALCKKLGISTPRCYVLLGQYDESEGPSSLIRSKRGRKPGSSALSPEVDSIIEVAIKETWIGPGTRVTAVKSKVDEMCRAANCSPPGYRAVNARVGKKNRSEMMGLQQGKKKANDVYQARPNHNEAKTILEKWQMDHCVIDCIIVDEKDRKPLCRPWATLIIDVYSRVVIGFYLSIHAPSSYSVAMAVTHATLPKNRWLEAVGDTDISYPYYGKGENISMDNAKEFKARGFRIAAKKHQIKLHWRPYGKPWWGGHIERLNGTLAMGHIHYLPGTTLSNVVLKGDYDSEKNACLTFSEFRLWFAREIQIYHHTVHRILGVTPHEKWMEASMQGGSLNHPELVVNPFEFTLDFLPEHSRVISRQGIELNRIQYWSGALYGHVKVHCTVKYNPLSLKQVWVNPTGEGYIEVPYYDIRRPDVSLEELKLAKQQLARERHIREGSYARKVSVDEIFELIKKNRELVERSRSTTKKLKKIKENSSQSIFFDDTTRHLQAEDLKLDSDDLEDDDDPPGLYKVDF
ncbi:transposase family protein [Pseudomonas sp. BE134]|uniref:transposase family protein n=1 Tax=Pseudomonas sp. BE134 TaxID=2817843 RepID=UPI002863B384|nr:transposase family protein [Pseudomonas sp. BE134]MDR6924253.1 putative transposase [Pseudomonas sp. BE134]